ncbi:Gp138 family membrane-puncturing spike protein [Serratia microhaemolytica]|uniref:Gp138 family membrane-puncturing spike protein n=1 Tax=Serratia microhaemolytica TaxID=2675110 RepID=UPI000FDDD59E|nr:Gp138 family membrane-puncturing spike protein [Serratia microhaemolytica]
MAETHLGSIDPGARESLAGVIEFAIKKSLQRTDVQLPAVVISYDREKNLAMVKPLISRLTTAGDPVERPTIASIPVLSLGGGGISVTFPLKSGDLGWIEASDRDISLFMQSKASSRPNTLRLHEFSDARFIPDVFNRYTLPSHADDEAIIQHTNGTTFIGISGNRIRGVTGGSSATLTESTVNVKTGSAEIAMANSEIVLSVGGSKITITETGITINGVSFTTAGAVSSPSSFTAPSMSAGGTRLESHRHTGGTMIDGRTGAPTA